MGDAVWLSCHIIPNGGTRKRLRAWRGPHKVTDVLQDGRLYVLETGQNVHFEGLKKHVPAPWDWAAHQPFLLDQIVAIIENPYVDNNEEITSDISRDSFLPEQLPEASFEMRPTAPVPPRTIQTRTQAALEQEGIQRRRLSHFGYQSESESDHEPIEQPGEETQQPVNFPD